MSASGRKTADSALVAALVAGATRAKAAEQAGVSEGTVYRRLTDPDFRQQLQAARSESVEQSTALLTRASPAAVGTLVQLLQPTVPPSTRLGAARAILELGGKLRATEELESRIEALEARLDQPQPARAPWAA